MHHFQQAVADNKQRALVAKVAISGCLYIDDYVILQRTQEEAERKEKAGELKKKRGDGHETVIDELSLRLADGAATRGRKVDSSQIEHGDFEKIINGV